MQRYSDTDHVRLCLFSNTCIWCWHDLIIAFDTYRKQPNAYPFLEPVDVIKLNIPDYPLYVKHPMDLGTVKKNLLEGKYTEAEAFANDVRRVSTQVKLLRC